MKEQIIITCRILIYNKYKVTSLTKITKIRIINKCKILTLTTIFKNIKKMILNKKLFIKIIKTNQKI
jgi:hypothetical protein